MKYTGLHSLIATAAFFGFLAWAPTSWAADAKYCGKEGVWLQILGSGGAELDDRRSSAAYVVWLDGVARLLIDAGPGTSCLLYTSPSPRDQRGSRMPSSA